MASSTRGYAFQFSTTTGTVPFVMAGCSVTDIAVIRITSNVDGIAFSDPFEHEIAKVSAGIGANVYYLDPTEVVNKNTERILEVSGKAIRFACGNDPLPPYVVFAAANSNPKDGVKILKNWEKTSAIAKINGTEYGKLMANIGPKADDLIFSQCFGVENSSITETPQVLLWAYNGPQGKLFREWLGISSSTSPVTSWEQLRPLQTLTNGEIQSQFAAAEKPVMEYLKQALALQVGEDDYTAYANFATAAGVPDPIIPYAQYASTTFDRSNLCSGIHAFVAAKKSPMRKPKKHTNSKPKVGANGQIK